MLNDAQTTLVKEKLSELADQWLFSRKVYPEDMLCETYTVKPGEILSTIGNNYKTPWEILAEINNVRPETLQAGKPIKVINGPFHLKVYLSKFKMDLFLQDTYVKTYPVGIGRKGHETPTGLWVVQVGGKLKKPTWTDPDTGRVYDGDDLDYPLGSRWIELDGLEDDAVGRTGFAIHGTKDSSTIGTASSRGCIRLFNGNAILMYNLLMPGHSHVRTEK